MESRKNAESVETELKSDCGVLRGEENRKSLVKGYELAVTRMARFEDLM